MHPSHDRYLMPSVLVLIFRDPIANTLLVMNQLDWIGSARLVFKNVDEAHRATKDRDSSEDAAREVPVVGLGEEVRKDVKILTSLGVP